MLMPPPRYWRTYSGNTRQEAAPEWTRFRQCHSHYLKSASFRRKRLLNVNAIVKKL